MRPLIFDGCFGWLHAARGPVSAGLGVVLCRPLGNEDLCTHREWMDLADMLAEAGMPALRFDYTASGDSWDGDEHTPLLRRWLDSVRQAVSCLIRETGVTQVALCGVRLGSALAYLAAQELQRDGAGVAALVLMAPVVSGKAYARELRAQASASNLAGIEPPPPESSDLPLNLHGFLWSQEVLRDLAGIKLEPPSAAPRVLLVNKVVSKQTASFAVALRLAGAVVEEKPFDGYDDFMYAPFSKATPVATFTAVVDWLREAAPVVRAPLLRAPVITPDLNLSAVRETPLTFGPDQRLFGMLCEPARSTSDFIVLLVHTGTNHHVGNGRMTVHMARRLAARGIASLRMDPAGLGDSPDWPDATDNPLYRFRALDDVTMALDALETHGYRRAMIFGLCAGAYLALHAAVSEPRIVAAVPTNLEQFIWEEGMSLEVTVRQTKRTFRSYLRSMTNWNEWKRVLRGEGDPLGIIVVLARRGLAQIWHRVRDVLPPKPGSKVALVRGWAQALSERGVKSWYVYSEEDPGLVEFSACFGRAGKRLRTYPNSNLVIVPNAEHNLNAVASREQFFQLFEEWATQAAETRL